MPVLIQVCIVVVSVSLLVVAVMTVRLLDRINKAADDFSSIALTVRESAARLDRVSQEALALTVSLQSCVPTLQRVVHRIETLGRRTADLSSALLEVIEPPVFAAAAMATGVKSGVSHLVQRLLNRFTHRDTSHNGGYDRD